MGKVYRARQLALDKPVVLKVLRQSLLSDERTVARFQREAKAASRLNHPNSISILDFGQAEDGALFIAMEFVPGQDLHQILSRDWPLPESRVVRIVSQVLSALSDAHGAGVIHRDLKPENIMVEQRRNDADFVKVLDFGIAKITDSTGDDGPALTRAGFVCGTPEYMSPEQARGAQLDHRSDLYAVGVILYQLTTGLLPFESDSAVGFATKHLTEEPPPPVPAAPRGAHLPGLERLILRALSKNPDDRPANAEAFKAELLAVDRERRRGRGHRPPRLAAGSGLRLACAGLAGARAAAAPGHGRQPLATQPGTDPGWGMAEPTVEATVRAVPELMMKTTPNPMPSSDRTEAIVPTVSEEGGLRLLQGADDHPGAGRAGDRRVLLLHRPRRHPPRTSRTPGPSTCRCRGRRASPRTWIRRSYELEVPRRHPQRGGLAPGRDGRGPDVRDAARRTRPPASTRRPSSSTPSRSWPSSWARCTGSATTRMASGPSSMRPATGGLAT